MDILEERKILEMFRKTETTYESLRNVLFENLQTKEIIKKEFQEIEIKDLEVFKNEKYSCYFLYSDKSKENCTCFIYEKDKKNQNSLTFTNLTVLENFLNYFGFKNKFY